MSTSDPRPASDDQPPAPGAPNPYPPPGTDREDDWEEGPPHD